MSMGETRTTRMKQTAGEKRATEEKHMLERLDLHGPTRVMGVVNVTPDSFSDGGEWFQHQRAIEHAFDLTRRGAHIIDVGGESTRPGSGRTPAEEETRRVLPVVTALSEAGVLISVDTMRAEVAQACLERGAHVINDVSGGMADPDMLGVVADSGAAFIAQHWRAHSHEMDAAASYGDVVAEMCGELAARRDAALEAGIGADRLVLDPGFGFANRTEHNWEILRRLEELKDLGQPLLLGVSRKRFLGELLADADGPRPAKGRDAATAAVTALVAGPGVWAVRTHEVAADADAIKVAERMRGPR